MWLTKLIRLSFEQIIRTSGPQGTNDWNQGCINCPPTRILLAVNSKISIISLPKIRLLFPCSIQIRPSHYESTYTIRVICTSLFEICMCRWLAEEVEKQRRQRNEMSRQSADGTTATSTTQPLRSAHLLWGNCTKTPKPQRLLRLCVLFTLSIKLVKLALVQFFRFCWILCI